MRQDGQQGAVAGSGREALRLKREKVEVQAPREEDQLQRMQGEAEQVLEGMAAHERAGVYGKMLSAMPLASAVGVIDSFARASYAKADLDSDAGVDAKTLDALAALQWMNLEARANSGDMALSQGPEKDEARLVEEQAHNLMLVSSMLFMLERYGSDQETVEALGEMVKSKESRQALTGLALIIRVQETMSAYAESQTRPEPMADQRWSELGPLITGKKPTGAGEQALEFMDLQKRVRGGFVMTADSEIYECGAGFAILDESRDLFALVVRESWQRGTTGSRNALRQRIKDVGGEGLCSLEMLRFSESTGFRYMTSERGCGLSESSGRVVGSALEVEVKGSEGRWAMAREWLGGKFMTTLWPKVIARATEPKFQVFGDDVKQGLMLECALESTGARAKVVTTRIHKMLKEHLRSQGANI